MHPILRNILAVIVGVVVGSIVNMTIVMQGTLPEGVNMENLAENMHLFEANHFVMPILGHALGTLAGAILAGLIAATHKTRFALSIGVFFLFGGIANIMMLKFPLIPAVLDLVLAYIPMGWLGGKIALMFSKSNETDVIDNFHTNKN